MKHLFRCRLTALMLALMWLATIAHAQSAPVINVNVPFEFTFCDRTFPAGAYSLALPEQHLLELHDSRGLTIHHVLTEGIGSAPPEALAKLKFRVSDGQHILIEVWLQQQGSGERLAPVNHTTLLAKRRSTETLQTAEESQP